MDKAPGRIAANTANRDWDPLRKYSRWTRISSLIQNDSSPRRDSLSPRPAISVKVIRSILLQVFITQPALTLRAVVPLISGAQPLVPTKQLTTSFPARRQVSAFRDQSMMAPSGGGARFLKTTWSLKSSGHLMQLDRFKIKPANSQAGSWQCSSSALAWSDRAICLVRPSAQSRKILRELSQQTSTSGASLVLQDLQGELVSLDDYQGKIVLVNNWATWCPPCRAEMPTLQAYYNEHRHQDFILVAIDSGDPPRQVAEFAKQFNLTFPIWVDQEMKAIQGFRNQALPSSYLIDKRGTVILAWSGAINQDNLEKYVTPFIED
jgi:thiol-disulfide isomerase/thioredoxin